MIHTDLVSRFALLVFVLCCIPGPAVLATVATALRLGASAGLVTATGVLCANATYFVLSGLGVAALLSASYSAFTVVKYAGAAYLAYLGLRSLFVRDTLASDSAEDSVPVHAERRRAFAAGVVTQLANPKAIVFFVAVVPQFIAPHDAFAPQLALLTIVSTLIEFGVLSTYVALAVRVRALPKASGTPLWFQRVGGAALVLVAAGIAREPLGTSR